MPFWPADSTMLPILFTGTREPLAVNEPETEFRFADSKSRSVAPAAVLDRVSVRKLVKWGTVSPKTALRSTPISTSSPACGEVLPVLSANVQGTDVGVVFTKKYVAPTGGVINVRLPVASLPVQR